MNENINTWCVGLTGGLASGKTTVTDTLSNLGVFVADADKTGHALTAHPDSPGIIAARRVLGDWAFDDNGNMRREAVRDRIFNDPALREQLQRALHPPIRAALKEELQAAEKAGYAYTVLSAPLLLESDALADFCARIAVVDCPPEVQIERATRRDGFSEEIARSIIAAQMPRQERLARADDVIANDGDLEALQKLVKSFHETWTEMAKNARAEN